MLNDIYAANLGDDMCQVYIRTEPAQWYIQKIYRVQPCCGDPSKQ